MPITPRQLDEIRDALTDEVLKELGDILWVMDGDEITMPKIENARLTLLDRLRPLVREAGEGETVEPERERLADCDRFSPPEWTGHWREWHRGHGCKLDPDAQRKSNEQR